MKEGRQNGRKNERNKDILYGPGLMAARMLSCVHMIYQVLVSAAGGLEGGGGGEGVAKRGGWRGKGIVEDVAADTAGDWQRRGNDLQPICIE